MKKTLLLLFSVFLVGASFGQTEKTTYKTAADHFEERYNASDYEAIFASFSPEMKIALPIEKTKIFLSELKAQAGQITKREFVRYKATYASYKTNFERSLLAVNISIDENSKINGLFVGPYRENNLPTPERNKTKLILPFKGEWTVVWGGDTKELNYHVENEAQKNAFDFVVTNEKGKSFRTNGKTNEDYYAFGKEISAPCDGEIVLVVDGIKDNVPGVFNPVYVPGNTVILKTKNNEYLLFAHFKQHTIVVEQGDIVEQGQLLGLCGNSGNSSEPHLHFHIQNVESMNIATGMKCYFKKMTVNGETKQDYSPIKGDKIKPGQK